MTKYLEDIDIEVLRTPAFEQGLFKRAVLKEIKGSGIRIMILGAYDADVQKIALIAGHEAMNRAKGWAWVMVRSAILHPVAVDGWLWMRPFFPSRSMRTFAEQVGDCGDNLAP